MDQYMVKKILLLQIENYISKKITKEQFNEIAEAYFSKYAKYIEDSDFYNIFSSNIPLACTIYIDEPGDTEEKKEMAFRKILEKTYNELRGL